MSRRSLNLGKKLSAMLIIASASLLVGRAQTAPHASSKTHSEKNSGAKNATPTAALRVKVADGRYELVGGNAGTQKYREPWTLYKTSVGYELQEQWTVASSNAAESSVDVAINFAAGLYPIQVRIGGENTQRQLTCSMALKEFKCATGGKESKLVMQGPYNVFLPSPWLLGSIARRAKKVPNQSATLQLVMMAGSVEQGPKLVSFPAEVQYVGDDEVSVRGEKIPAAIYELKAINTGIQGVTIPGTLIWTSNEGVVLALQDSNKPDQRIELVEYKRYGKF